MSSSSDNCTYYNEERFAVVAAVRATVGTLSAVCCLLVAGMILLFRKYRCFCQRLILYLAVAAFVHSLSYPLARVNYYTPRQLHSPYCNFAGFFSHYTSWVEVLALCCLTFNVFLNAVVDKWLTRLEAVYIFLPYLLPFLWVWIPFINHSFGNGEAWCDIRPIESDCSRYLIGDIMRFVLWYVPLYILCIAMLVAALVAAYMIHRNSKLWYGIHDPFKEEKTNMLKSNVRPLIWYPVLYSILNVFSVANQVDVAIDPTNTVLVLWYLHVLTSPLRGAVIALAYALDHDTRRRLNWTQLKTALRLCYRGDDVDEYSAVNCSVSESVHHDYQSTES